MKRLKTLLVVLALLLSFSAYGQKASINAPQAKPAEKDFKVKDFVYLDACACFQINVSVVDANGDEARVMRVRVPDESYPSLTLFSFGTQVFVTGRPTETGNWGRRANFRIIGALADAGYFGDPSTLTITP